MSLQAFVSASPISLRPISSSLNKSTFISSRTVIISRTQPKPAVLKMQSEDYVIQQSEFVDPEGDDDSGDGFIGAKDNMDDYLGIGMPDDMSTYDRQKINEANNRDELEATLREIHSRRRDIYEDRRKGMGMEGSSDYLGRL